ncbi:histidine kinase dimerization/phosphoacceptor domain -containing protein [Cytophagaceae bacterium YF14B1]|uniref:histidine kinase n=1 Tax=Xanthocytophaga flava TaxID=3048013 RepID=A0AAE3U8E4_9BACT|nr:histidine kinase dimerization/phosphoacceptor domain -containing protein [Xanthocytophaga flavus]MDJ1482582.1 histidine kinase dimerization/phosphoacceptor domain -containing protein [Xanthocytophaga flavus]
MIYLTRTFYVLLVSFCCCVDLVIKAEPFYLKQKQDPVDSIRRLLKQNSLKQKNADTHQVNLLLQLSSYYLNRNPPNADSAYLYAGQSYTVSNSLHFQRGQIESLYLMGDALVWKGKGKAGRNILLQGVSLSKQQGDTLQQAMGWLYIAASYGRTDAEIPEKINAFEQAMLLFQKIGNKEREAHALKEIADMHFWQGKSAQSLGELLQVVALYRSINYPKIHYTYDLLVAVNKQLGNYKDAIQYGLASIESARAAHDTASFGLFHGRLGAIHGELKQWNEGLVYLQKALGYFEQDKNIWMVLHTARLISANLIAQKQPQEALDFFLAIIRKYPPEHVHATLEVERSLGDCYLALKQYAQAEKHYLQMIHIEESRDGKGEHTIVTYEKAGSFYLAIQQYDKARAYLEKALRLQKEAGTLLTIADIHLKLFRIDSAQARYSGAIAHYQRYKSLNDSIFNETKSKQIATLQIQYDTRQKEQNIALLTEQNQVQLGRIREREIQRNSIIAGATLLLLLLGLIYRQYQVKKRNNEQLQAQQLEISRQNVSLQELLKEKEWLLKEVHHRVKNNLQMVISLLESQSAYLERDALQAVRDSQHRIFAMSLIHQKLYQEHNVATIDMLVYLHELVHYLRESFETRQYIRFELQIQPIELDATQAIPLGLILNEALTNALKYAFPNNQDGLIRISLTEQADNHLLLTVSDNGVGLPASFDSLTTSTLGMKLMQGLSQDINARLEIESQQGTLIRIRFMAHPVLGKLPVDGLSLADQLDEGTSHTNKGDSEIKTYRTVDNTPNNPV